MRIKQVLGLSLSLAKAKFKLRNEGTWLGVFWYLLGPLLTFLLLLGIFTDRLGKSIPSYPLYLLLGIMMFNYFDRITFESTRVIKEDAGLIKSLKFPRESLIGSIVLVTLFSHFFEIVVLIFFLIFFNIPIKMMVFYPLILLFLSVFALGSSLILASWGFYSFDLDNIWIFLSRIIWFVTPIFYAIEGQTRLFYINLFNPMYYFITIARELIIYARMPEFWMMIVAIGYSLLFLIIGSFIFNKLKVKFAEMV